MAPRPAHDNYDMWEGIEYELAIRKLEGKRVTCLEYKGNPLLPEHEVGVVMNNYRGGGGGDYMLY